MTDPAPSRCARLRAATRTAHESLDARVMRSGFLADRTGYRRFLRLQHRFSVALRPLYRDPALNRMLPGLSGRDRTIPVEADLRALGLEPSAHPSLPPVPEPAAALGWLYCSEGSTLGAAFLLKALAPIGINANSGARHLAPHPGGRGRNWAGFAAALDALALSPAEERACVDGALAAFAFYRAGLEAVPADA
jgi:heme oxygenase (biliverdin-IX-beta and delta-forming)